MAEAAGSEDCVCTADTESSDESLAPYCLCPRDDHDIVVHETHCLQYRNEKMVYPHGEACTCEECRCICTCPPGKCTCFKAGREAFDEWRQNRDIACAMPAVLEPNHPLMKRFQETLKRFLEKENAIAEEEILNLRDELRLSKEAYDKDLETIYRDDHDTNAQRTMIEEYEANLSQRAAEREAMEKRARESGDKYRRAKEKLDQDINNEREATEELEALTTLCRQLEQWREETESDLTVSQHMSEKMKKEKQALADEKRQLDMVIYGLNTEVWKLESKLEMFQKQFEIKSNEMEKVNDKVTAYAAELEDLELDKRRLVSLWNSVLINIAQRDKVYDSVRDDYRLLQENYRTLINNLEITKKVVMDEINKGKEIAMNKDKLLYDLAAATKLYDAEEAKRIQIETKIMELTESIEMCERDQGMIQSENQTMLNILKSREKDYDRKTELKMKLESEILTNLQECLLNDKAVEAMANGIKKIREMSRKQEINLMNMENQHAKVMLDIEVHRNRQAKNQQLLEEHLAKVKARENTIDELEEAYEQNNLLATRKQRELDILNKKFAILKELFDSKSPQERRIEELEQQIKSVREHTESLQHEWLRLQGHVVKLTSQHHKLVADVNLIRKQIQICEQKSMRIQAECKNVQAERMRVERSLRDLRGRLEVLERTRNESALKNDSSSSETRAFAFEYDAGLKDAENEIFQLEEDIEAFEKDKTNLTQELDRLQREALIWQRKGILAVELKRNVHDAKSAAGEIGQMRTEIHRMEVRREQLRRISDKLADDLAQCVNRRENVMDKARATAAVEKAHGSQGQTSQSAYHHKLRLAKADVARVTKDVNDAQSLLVQLEKEQKRLESEVEATSDMIAKLEEKVASLLKETIEADRLKQWLLERVIRKQRLGGELAMVIKRQSLKTSKNKPTILQDYSNMKNLNERVRSITDTLLKEYPHLEDRLLTVLNTLNIHSPGESPNMSDEECIGCDEDVNKAERPFCDDM